jgi:hypothetical protein
MLRICQTTLGLRYSDVAHAWQVVSAAFSSQQLPDFPQAYARVALQSPPMRL